MTGQAKPVEADREKWPGLSDKERERRWERVRQLMISHDLDGLVVFGLKGREWLDRYLTNDATGGITILSLERGARVSVPLSWGFSNPPGEHIKRRGLLGPG